MAKQIQRRFQGNYNRLPIPGETNSLPSITVPDMAMSIQEIFQRFASGRPVNFNNNLVYGDDLGGDEFYPDLRTYDLTEMQELAEANNERIASLKKELEDKKRKRDEYRLRKQIEKEEAANNVTKNENKVKINRNFDETDSSSAQ